jgi:hypothetical protein
LPAFPLVSTSTSISIIISSTLPLSFVPSIATLPSASAIPPYHFQIPSAVCLIPLSVQTLPISTLSYPYLSYLSAQPLYSSINESSLSNQLHWVLSIPVISPFLLLSSYSVAFRLSSFPRTQRLLHCWSATSSSQLCNLYSSHCLSSRDPIATVDEAFNPASVSPYHIPTFSLISLNQTPSACTLFCGISPNGLIIPSDCLSSSSTVCNQLIHPSSQLNTIREFYLHELSK